jgi:hypothetical protein
MRAVGAVLGVALGVGALAGTIWVARYSPWVDQSPHKSQTIAQETVRRAQREAEAQKDAPAKTNPPKAEPTAPKQEEKPAPVRPRAADKPPFPKVATAERAFEFGAMGVNEEKKHSFKISNKGEAPLELEVGPCTCKCTLSGLSKKKVPPGESVDVELTWKPIEVASNFAQQCTIWTNDPDSPDVMFKVYGEVAQKYQVVPEKAWHAGHVTDAQDGSATAQIYSSVEKFGIKSVDSGSPHVKVNFAPMEMIQIMNLKVKAGYEFKIKVDRGIAMGQFRVPVHIHTTLEGNRTIQIDVTGSRSGPVLFLPPWGHAIWNAEKSYLNLGRVNHEKGTKVTLPAIVYGIKEKFQVLKATSDAEFLHVSTEPDPEISAGEQQGVRIIFEIPAGSPPVTRVSPNAVHVTLETNHPRLKKMEFQVEFVGQ